MSPSFVTTLIITCTKSSSTLLYYAAESEKCGSFGCIPWTEDYIGWEKLGIGRMLVFMGVEGVACYVILALVELKVFVQLRYAASWICRRVSTRNGEYNIHFHNFYHNLPQHRSCKMLVFCKCNLVS